MLSCISCVYVLELRELGRVADAVAWGQVIKQKWIWVYIQNKAI